MSLSFDWDVNYYNGVNDDASYELFYDGTSQGIVYLLDGGVDEPYLEGSVDVSVTDDVNTLDLKLYIRDDGLSGFSGYDNFMLVGDPVQALNASISAIPTDICENDLVQLEVDATGGTGTYSYSWTSIPVGFTSDIYNPSDNPVETITYYVNVSDGISSIDQEVTVNVKALTNIITEPTGASLCVGDSHTFEVIADGSNLSYQWQLEGLDIDGATSSTYTVSTADLSDNGDYTCIVTGDCGTVTSIPAGLTVVTNTAISTEPTGASLCVGDSHTFEVIADGSNLSYQWQLEGLDIDGATSSTYTVFSADLSDNGDYTCIVTGDCGTVTSTPTGLTVVTNTAISTEPTGASLCVGDSHTFEVIADGSNLTYQWQLEGLDIDGATSSTYTVSSADLSDNGDYTCIVIGDCGTVTSIPVGLTVVTNTAISTEPTGASLCVGDSHTFEVIADGSNL
ncbi:MAG: hypothetical protein C0596_01035, partial [Marinilabiliales bacterium]